MVIAGTLRVDGSMSISPLTTVHAGGTLAGVGFVGNTQVSGGTLTPGSAGGNLFGPLTVQGKLAFTAASTYMFWCRQPMPAATFGGATVNAVFLPGSYVDWHTPSSMPLAVSAGRPRAVALNYASQTATATRTELGLRSDKSIAMQDAVLTLRGRAAWAHDDNPDRASDRGV